MKKIKQGISNIFVLKRGLRNNAILCGMSAIILIGVIYLYFVIIQKSGYFDIGKISDKFHLSPLTSGELNEVIKTFFFLVKSELVTLVYRVFFFIYILFSITEILKFIIFFVLTKILKNEAVSIRQPFDLVMSKKLFYFGLKLIFMVFVILTILPQRFLEKPILPISATVLIVAFIFVLFYWRRLHSLLASGRKIRLAVIAYISAPFNRLQNWVSMALLILMAFIVIHSFIPWIFREARSIPNRLEQRMLTAYSMARFDNLKHLIEDDYQQSYLKKFGRKLEPEKMKTKLKAIFHPSTLFKKMSETLSGSFGTKTIDKLSRQIMKVISIMFAIVFIGLILGPPILLGLRGKKLLVIISASLLPLPSLFVLDRMGITSSLPLLWIAVMAPFAIGDAVLSNQTQGVKHNVYFIKGRALIHDEITCIALQGVSRTRISEGDATQLMRVAHFTQCGLCCKVKIFRGKKGDCS